MRLTSEELQALMKKEGVDRIWSWSKINCFHISCYEYYLKYIKKVKEDRANSIYVTMGGIAHNILEKFYTNELHYDEMIGEFEDGWTVAVDIADLKFNRTDEEKNARIKEKYYENLVHFFNNHTILDKKPVIEQFIKIKVDNNLFHGYIDCAFKDDESNVHIVDFKTSSIYKGAKAENECGQLVLYALGLNQQGVPFDKIRICWNFLKYVSIQYQQKNGAIKTKETERCKIGESLQSNAKTWLKHFGYKPDEYLMKLLDTNDIACLPQEVREKYVISDCYIYVNLTDKLIEKWTTHISTVIKDIRLREQDYNKTHNEKIWWDSEESVKAQSYYFSNLCSYSPRLHKPYGEYLDKLEQQKNGQDLFCGLNTTSSMTNNKDNELDLSWLDAI